MKVVMLCMTRYNSRFVNKGDTIDMDPTSARRMESRGICEIIEEPKPKSKKEGKKNKVKDVVEDNSAVDTGPNESEEDFIDDED